MLKAMLRAQGCSIRHQQLLDLVDFVNKTCRWFAEEVTVNVETWEKVGKQLTDCYIAEVPEKIPIPTFSLCP